MLLSACGGGGGSSAPTSTTSAPTSIPSSTTSPAGPAGPVAAPEFVSPDAAALEVNSDLQVDLQEVGLSPGPVTGEFNPATEAALVSFQKGAGVPTSEQGALGPNTALVLETRLGGTSDVVSALQSALTDLGAFHDVIDGQFGTTTSAALKRLQSSTGLSITGLYDPQTATALASAYLQQVKEPAVKGDLGATGSGTYQLGSSSTTVSQIQQVLGDLGFRAGSDPGVFDAQTASAVIAFQKRAGLTPNGIVGPSTLSALENPIGAQPEQSGPDPRVEVDLAHQVVYVVRTGQPVVTLNASTGTGLAYTLASGAKAVAYTPSGSFSIVRKQSSDVAAPFGSFYDPLFFDQGWAIEGSANVPGYPASYGSVRISLADANWLYPLVAVGTPVIVYGGSPTVPAGAAPGY